MKKMAPWIITILLALILVVMAAYLVMTMNNKNTPAAETHKVEEKKLSADERVEVTSTMEQVKTNLSDPNYVVIMDFAFQLNDAAAKEAFDKIMNFNVKSIIIKTLADTKPTDLTGAKGKDQLANKLKNLINQTLPEGNIVQIDITNFIMSPI
ncbi:flagellar basal body-associated FliL family protein [Paenibacillus sp. YPG26]|uniref:flagellar basal body-associated FliL family protein n=1 Tax=Paenibacillus sp. YPG26 TaxID=2878915 RepID=UPI002040F625|nr:flagellar basal body-associated FliL family protein [Paenibacillus sp. YPG26]USB32089.1 flagellar basal body-associated FliL family protein [Paenibacillus sp. YPG26]